MSNLWIAGNAGVPGFVKGMRSIFSWIYNRLYCYLKHVCWGEHYHALVFFEHADEVVNLLCVVCSVPSFTETTGQFRTAGAKEYPPGFCAALVHTLLGGLAARHCRESLRVVQWSQLEERDRDWITAVELASSRCISSHFLPDYQPHWSALLHVSTERLSISCRMKNEFKAHPEFWEEHCKLSNLPPLHRFPHNVYIEPWSCW